MRSNGITNNTRHTSGRTTRTGKALVGLIAVAVALGAAPVQAATWNTNGGTYTSAQINAAISDGDTVNVNVDTIFNIDGTSTDLIASLVVFGGQTLTVNFDGAGLLKFGNATDDGNASITVNSTGTMTVTGTGGGYLDFSPTDTGNIFTINGTIAGTAAGNAIAVGNNVLKTATNTTALNDVTIGGAAAELDIDVATSIDTLTFTGAGDDLTITIAEGLTLTIDDQVTQAAGTVVTLVGTNGGAAETLTCTNGLSLNGAAAELAVTGDTGNNTAINAALTVDTDGAIIDLANSATITSVTMTAGVGNLEIQTDNAALVTTVDVNDNTLTLSEDGMVTTVQLDTSGGAVTTTSDCRIQTLTVSADSTVTVGDNTTLTVTDASTLSTGNLTIQGTGAGNTDTIDFDGGLTLNTGAELTIGGAGGGLGLVIARDGGTTDALTIAAGASVTLDVDDAATIQGISVAANGSGNLTVQTGANTLTVTGGIDVNDNTLTLNEAGPGTISQVDLDTAGGEVEVDSQTTLTALNVTHTSGSVTISNDAQVDGTIAVSGVGGTTLFDGTATVTDIDIDATGACTLDLNTSFTATNFDLDGAGAVLTVAVASGQTLTATNGIDVQDEDLVLSETGTVSAVDIDGAVGSLTFSAAGTVTTLTTTANGTIAANANGIITTLSLGGDLGITFGDGVNLTVSNSFNVGANTLTLTGSGGTGQDTFTCTAGNGIVLNNNGSELDIAATDAADNLTGFEVYVSGAVSPTFDVNETCAPTSVTVAAGAGATPTISVATGKTLTSTVDINDNTVTVDEAGSISTVTTSTDGGTLDVNESCTVGTLTLSGLAAAEGVTLDLAGTKNLTITNAVSVPAGVILTYKGANAANTKTLTLTGGLSLAGNASELALTTDVTGTMAIAGTITAASNTTPTIIDLNTKTNTLTDLELDDSCTVECDSSADTCTLTIASAVNVDAGAVLTFTGTDDGNADTLTFTGGLSLNGDAAELEVSGDDTTAMVIGGNVTCDTATGVIDVDNSATFSGNVDANAALTVDVATGKTLTASNGIDTNTSTVVLSSPGTVSQVDLDGASGTVQITGTAAIITDFNTSASGTLDVDDNLTISTDTPLGADLTVNVANGKTITFTDNNGTTDGFNPSSHTLTIAGTGTINEITLAANDILTVNEDVTLTRALNVGGAATLNIAASQTWTETVAAGTNDITLGGTGTLSALTITVPDGGTRTITAAASGSQTITTFTPTWVGNGVLLFTGTGDLALTSKLTPDGGDDVQKTGTGTLTLTGGFGFDDATADTDLDIDAGTVVIGASGGADAAIDLTFNDDDDSIDVANGATLTTFGDVTGTAGGNTNFTVGTTGTLNLNSAAARDLTITENNDFNWNGTINLAGTDSDYTLAGAFIYQFGTVNVNTTGSLIYQVDNGKIDFQPSGGIVLTGSGTLTIGATDTNEVVLDTVGDTGTWTLNRGGSSNMTLGHIDLSRCTYASSTGYTAQCDSVTYTNVDFTAGNTNFAGDCPERRRWRRWWRRRRWRRRR